MGKRKYRTKADERWARNVGDKEDKFEREVAEREYQQRQAEAELKAKEDAAKKKPR